LGLMTFAQPATQIHKTSTMTRLARHRSSARL